MDGMDFTDSEKYTISAAGGNQYDNSTTLADGFQGEGGNHRQHYSTSGPGLYPGPNGVEMQEIQPPENGPSQVRSNENPSPQPQQSDGHGAFPSPGPGFHIHSGTNPPPISNPEASDPLSPLPPPVAIDPTPPKMNNSQRPVGKPTTPPVNFCPSCGHRNTSPSNNFCPQCGNALGGSSTPHAEGYIATGTPQVPQTPQVAPQVISPPGQITSGQPGERNPWATELVGIDDCGGCLLGFIAPCVLFGQNAEILDKGDRSCLTSTLLYTASIFVGLTCCYSYTYRAKMRVAFNLRKEPCNDILTHLCCTPCALAQEHRELRRRGIDSSLGFHSQKDKVLQQMEMKAPVPQRMKQSLGSAVAQKAVVIRDVLSAFFG